MTKDNTGRVLTIAFTVGGVLLLWVVDGPLAGRELLVRQGGGVHPVGPVAVAGAALLAGLAAWALLTLLERAGRRSAYRYVASAGLVLSLAGPLTAAQDPAGLLALGGLHLTVGAALIIGLPGLRSHAGACRAPRTGTAP
ncbi:MAG TPA: DUF6069 family protein [Actinoplanes sp.]|nr:DUF6069 family protein [Actinoplanes sp.]